MLYNTMQYNILYFLSFSINAKNRCSDLLTVVGVNKSVKVSTYNISISSVTDWCRACSSHNLQVTVIEWEKQIWKEVWWTFSWFIAWKSSYITEECQMKSWWHLWKNKSLTFETHLSEPFQKWKSKVPLLWWKVVISCTECGYLSLLCFCMTVTNCEFYICKRTT